MGKTQGVRLGSPAVKPAAPKVAPSSVPPKKAPAAIPQLTENALGKQPAKTAPKTAPAPIAKPPPKSAVVAKTTKHIVKTTAAQTAASKALVSSTAELIALGKGFSKSSRRDKASFVKAIREHKSRLDQFKPSIHEALDNVHASLTRKTWNAAVAASDACLAAEQTSDEALPVQPSADAVSSSDEDCAKHHRPVKSLPQKAQKNR